MREGDIIFTPMPQVDGQIKNRPALFLRVLPPFHDALLCAISTQLSRAVAGFDELITLQDDNFVSSGLVAASVIRLGFLVVLPQGQLIGSIGRISLGRRKRLLKNLSEYLVKV